MEDAIYRDFLALLEVVGEHTAGLGGLLLEYSDPTAALSAPSDRLAQLPARTQAAVARARECWPGRRAATTPGRDSAAAAAFQFLPIAAAAYPAALRCAPDPPPWLFCRGDAGVLARPAVALVGSRRASRAGLHIARRLGRDLARRGYLVCSGLALGIDAAAHEGALEAGCTAAVLASGLDRASPACHRPLAQRIAASGCLLSELPPGVAPDRWRFPRRNRIISGLCEATIIVEAALPSGTLHTAHAALDQGRDVYILPWSVLHPGGRGCLRLLRDGATPITDLDELDERFPAIGAAQPVPSDPAGPGAPTSAVLDIAERAILDHIGDGAVDVDALGKATGLAPPHLLRHLTALELYGLVHREGGVYVRAPGSG